MFQEQTRCQTCRSQQLVFDDRRFDAAEIEAFNRLREQWAHDETDWQLMDPDHPGVLIWAKDLAKRYREQTKPRPVRGQMRKWL